ncbi:hypothetical protein [Micromonospora deserti]|uniref:Uncharacterized protein n=1 Tax=Micromonospora deserti TaxID=2070366 RepID=A0A2W2BVD5_9ACTN|nr:hypothetical protein [Micromonospora deserti]PZF90082.1 hypothetical protein C1I99_24810 [Micromonospora deserti]
MRWDRRRAQTARQLTDFDSSVNMVRALGRFLRGRDHRAMSIGPGSVRLADALSALPGSLRRRMFRWTGALQGIPLHAVSQVDADDISYWATQQYPAGQYPALLIGSASGAAVHLAAALRAPYLPQTTLVAIRDRLTHPDDPVGAMRAVAPLATQVARRNPDLAVYHMHDPAQDRPMLEAMAYLRLKRLRLGRTYERFIEERLEPGGTLILLESTRDWRVRTLADRAYFQFGCLGGVSEDEYHDSGDRITDYLAREGSPYRRWEPPQPDTRRPEAEWGFDPALRSDVQRLAARRGYRLRRMVTVEPQQLSPLVADLYRWWYHERGLPANRLLAESYVQWDPLWVLRRAVVPFWLRFNMRASYDSLRRYLDGTEPYDEIHVNLFSQGLWSPGVVPTNQWRELASSRAERWGGLIGVDEAAYPADVGSSLRYQPAYRSLPDHHSLPPALQVEDIDRFLSTAPVGRYPVDWM